jgi:hypothetical protein
MLAAVCFPLAGSQSKIETAEGEILACHIDATHARKPSAPPEVTMLFSDDRGVLSEKFVERR